MKDVTKLTYKITTKSFPFNPKSKARKIFVKGSINFASKSSFDSDEAIHTEYYDQIKKIVNALWEAQKVMIPSLSLEAVEAKFEYSASGTSGTLS